MNENKYILKNLSGLKNEQLNEERKKEEIMEKELLLQRSRDRYISRTKLVNFAQPPGLKLAGQIEASGVFVKE